MADISKIKIEDSVHNIKDPSSVAYGTCTTAAATAAKVIILTNANNWYLKTGSIIVVKFTYTNTANNPTFNVKNSGAKAVWYNTAKITTANQSYAGTANRPMEFMYDGTNWVFIGWSYDADTGAKVTQTNTTADASYRLLLSNSANDTTETAGLKKSAKFIANPANGNLSIGGNLLCKVGVFQLDSKIPFICHNGSNLWVGAQEEQTAQHSGKTFIAAGYDETNKTAYSTAYIAVTNDSNNNATGYPILHSNNYMNYALPLIGGTVSGYINFPKTGGGINIEQRDTSHCPTAIKWLKSGISQATYDPSISQHNIGGADGSGSLILLPYATDTEPWSGDVGLYIAKNTLKLDGKSVSMEDHTHNYLPLSGGSMTGTISSNKVTQSFLKGNQGQSIINSTAAAGSYVMLAKMNSNNGYFTHGTYQDEYLLQYTSKTIVDAGTNNVTKQVVLLNEAGNTSFPGTINGSIFKGTDQNFVVGKYGGYEVYLRNDGSNFWILLSDKNGTAFNSFRPFKINLETGRAEMQGEATEASKLSTARTINGVSFNGSKNITLTKFLWSGADTSVDLKDSVSNYDVFIVHTSQGVFLHYVSDQFSFHTFNGGYPASTAGGNKNLSIGEFKIYTSGTTISVSQCAYEINSSTTTVSAASTTKTVKLLAVWGLKLS